MKSIVDEIPRGPVGDKASPVSYCSTFRYPPWSLAQVRLPSRHQLSALELKVHGDLALRALEDQRVPDDGIAARIAGLAGPVAPSAVPRGHNHYGRRGLVLEVAPSVEHYRLLMTVRGSAADLGSTFIVSRVEDPGSRQRRHRLRIDLGWSCLHARRHLFKHAA